MDTETRKYISSIAQWIVDTYDISVPVDIDTIVQKLGGRIEVCHIGSVDELLYDGTLRKTGDTEFTITISQSQCQNPKRRTFAVAQELGHLFLHMGFITNPDLWSQQNCVVHQDSYTIEQIYQANEFAESLLMPETKYKEVLDRLTEIDYIRMSNVANYFKVSTSLAISRGKSLGYISPNS